MKYPNYLAGLSIFSFLKKKQDISIPIIFQESSLNTLNNFHMFIFFFFYFIPFLTGYRNLF